MDIEWTDRDVARVRLTDSSGFVAVADLLRADVLRLNKALGIRNLDDALGYRYLVSAYCYLCKVGDRDARMFLSDLMHDKFILEEQLVTGDWIDTVWSDQKEKWTPRF
jgi:hypothetical protein